MIKITHTTIRIFWKGSVWVIFLWTKFIFQKVEKNIYQWLQLYFLSILP